MTALSLALWTCAARAEQAPAPAHHAQLPRIAGVTRLQIGAGFRNVGQLEVSHAVSEWLSVGLWASERMDLPAPTLTPSAGTTLHLRRGNWGARLSGEWLGGLGGDGRVPGADVRAVALREGRLGRFWLHGGMGLMWVTSQASPDFWCVVDRLGASYSLSRRASVGLFADVPVIKLAGPAGHMMPTVSLQLRINSRS
ncbi:MAG: hypothetical protein KTR31_05680 [Myxococcales bacterium]|nr:hypothetical protein [Myxococcales bacterium]